MGVVIKEIEINTHGFTDVVDITDKVEALVSKYSKENDGLVNIICPGSTGGITTIEFEPGLKKDIKDYLEKIFPYNDYYAHHNTWHDDNGSAHIRSAVIGTSFTVPFQNKRLILGTWQQIVFIDFDTRPRRRRLVVTIMN